MLVSKMFDVLPPSIEILMPHPLSLSALIGVAMMATSVVPAMAFESRLPQSIRATLNESSQQTETGHLFAVHTFEGQAGQAIALELNSEQFGFDPYLVLLGPDGSEMATDDDGGYWINAQLVTVLPTDGTYQVQAQSVRAGEGGDYELVWRAPNESDRALAQANQLNATVTRVLNTESLTTAEATNLLPIAEDTVQQYQQILGTDHFDVALALSNLGILYRQLERHEDSQDAFFQVLRIYQNRLPAGHRFIDYARLDLAWADIALGRHRDSEPLFFEVLANHLPDSPVYTDTLATLRQLATFYRHQSQFEQSAELLEQLISFQQVNGDLPAHLLVTQQALAETLNAWANESLAEERYADAVSLYQATLALRQQLEQQSGEIDPEIAQVIDLLASTYRLQGRYDEAELLFLEALERQRTYQSVTKPDIARTLNRLALVYKAQGRYAEAIARHQEALEIYREHTGNDSPEVAQVLSNLGSVYQQQGQYAVAEEVYHQAMAVYQQQGEESRLNLTETQNNLAELYRLQGRYGEAESLLLTALATFQDAYGNRHSRVATMLNNLALIYVEQGRYAQAETLFEEAIAIDRDQLGDNHPTTATHLVNLASLYEIQGRYTEASNLFQGALAIRQTSLGTDHTSVASVVQNLAYIDFLTGNYGDADEGFQQALRLYRTNLGDTHPAVATVLNNQALLYEAVGRYEEAEASALQALSIYEATLGIEHPDYATALLNLSAIYQRQGRLDIAVEMAETALKIDRQTRGADHPSVGITLNKLAELHYQQGQYAEALTAAETALNIFQSAFTANHPRIAESLVILAYSYDSMGDYQVANPLYQQALAIRQETLGESHPVVGHLLRDQTLHFWEQGNYDDTLRTLAQTLEIEELNLVSTLPNLSEPQQQAYLSTIDDRIDWSLSLSLQDLPENLEAANLALETILRRKGRTLDIAASNQQVIVNRLTPEAIGEFAQLQAIRRQLAALRYGELAQDNPEQYLAIATELEAAANALETSLARKSSAFRGDEQPITLEAVQAAMPEDAVLIEFSQYWPYTPASSDQAHWGEPRYGAYVLDHTGLLTWVDLGDAEGIDQAITAFVDALQDTTQPPEATSQRLADILLAPILPALTGKQKLLISPDSQLNRVAFAALPIQNDRYLIEDFEITYLTSGRDLLRFNWQPDSQSAALVVANPNYDLALPPPNPAYMASAERRTRGTPSSDLASLQFGPLPGTAAEGDAIAALLPEVNLHTQVEATENLLKQVQAPRILHIATHGFFLADLPSITPTANQNLSIIPSANASLAFPEADYPLEDPLLRSGLALAGFNIRESGIEDGALTALEALSLNLYGTQLVVLSACETGLGAVSTGDSIYGLRRSLTIAGTQALLLSLWKVDDNATQAAMTQYYQYLLAGAGRSDALRQVMLEFIDSDSRYADPYYWAAFIMTGDWHPLD
jgi:tetratricopeptide (TPR) repeat protein